MRLASKEKYLVDTNILVYSVDKNSPFYGRARQLIEEGLTREVLFVVAHQNLIEFVAVLTRGYKREMQHVLQDVETFASHFDTIAPLPTTFNIFCALMRRVKNAPYDVFDGYLVATMIDNDVQRIITHNAKDFQGVGLKEVVSL